MSVPYTSTSEVYGTAQYEPIDENHPLQPQSPYSASKIGADQMALNFHLAFGLSVTIARPFSTYGPRQSARAVATVNGNCALQAALKLVGVESIDEVITQPLNFVTTANAIAHLGCVLRSLADITGL